MIEKELLFHSRRSPVFGRRGMIATSQPLAVQAGLEILNQGGSAADAAVATAAALNVTEPTSTGIGGDCFALYYEASTRQITALNGSGRAPGGLSIELLRRQGFGDTLPPFHAHTVTVPGACAGWCDLHKRFGRLPLSSVLAPAIRLAEDGFPVAPITAFFWARGVERQLSSATGGNELTLDGRAPKAGETFYNPGLARTLRVVAERGSPAFYQGEIASAITNAIQGAGGLLAIEDLAAHQSTWEEPISTTYRSLRIWECPPNGQGLAALIALNILEHYNPSKMAPLGAKRLHLIIEALRLAFADARWYITDPTFNPAPIEKLLSKAYAERRRHLIDLKKATHDLKHGVPFAGSDTVYLTVIDENGNACSFINSNYMGFGTGIVPQGWGFTLQNRGHNFSLDPKHPNALAPRKRPYHTIIPGMATYDDGSLYASFGVMGGFMQPQGHVQVLLALVDDGLDPQTALDQPRVCLTSGTSKSVVALEDGIPKRTLSQLSKMGHHVELVKGHARATFGRGQIIIRDEKNGILCGGSDPRADGCAIAQV
jgi:gamma-glutamyltranspeptidase/glutathione hydrolase